MGLRLKAGLSRSRLVPAWPLLSWRLPYAGLLLAASLKQGEPVQHALAHVCGGRPAAVSRVWRRQPDKPVGCLSAIIKCSCACRQSAVRKQSGSGGRRGRRARPRLRSCVRALAEAVDRSALPVSTLT